MSEKETCFLCRTELSLINIGEPEWEQNQDDLKHVIYEYVQKKYCGVCNKYLKEVLRIFKTELDVPFQKDKL